MGKKGRKTRWRKLPIPIGNGRTSCGSLNEEETERDDVKPQTPATNNVVKTTFNEDEYTKITTPRQDMLFKKGYLGKKKTIAVTPTQDSLETQSADSVESDQYICEEQIQPQYMYPSTGYVDHTGVYYINNSYEVYDPYTGNVTVIVGPGYPTGPHTGVLTAVPCQPVPLQPLEWFNPSIPQPHPAYSVPVYSSRKKRNSIDSQNCSGQSSETTCPPGSPQEPIESCEAPLYSPQYVYPGYMFGTPLYNMNGVTVQGVVPQSAPLPPPADQAKRRKKRRRRRRGGVTDEGSESSCEDMLSCDASGVAESHSGASSDTAPGSSSSKTNSDSGIHTDPTALTSGANSPRLPIDESYFHTETNGNEVEEEEVVTTYQQEQEVVEIIEEGSQRLSLEVVEAEQDIVEIEAEVEGSGEVIEEAKVEIEDEEKEEEHEEGPVIAVVEASLSSADESRLTEGTAIEDDNIEPSINKDSISPVTNIPNNESVILTEEETIAIHLDTEELIEEKSEVYLDKTEVEVKEELEGQLAEVVEEEIVAESVEECNNEITKLTENDIEPVTSRLTEQTIREGSCERPITEAVTKWLRSQGSSVVKLSSNSSAATSSSTEESEDEGIEEGEDVLVNDITNDIAGQKNVQGNPFLASSPSNDKRTRVAIYDYTKIEENLDNDWSIRVGHMCDAKRSVHKYYSLGTSVHHSSTISSESSSSNVPPAVLLKTAMHLGQAGPFPCGICCILQ